jgi:hypothetical protein
LVLGFGRRYSIFVLKLYWCWNRKVANFVSCSTLEINLVFPRTHVLFSIYFLDRFKAHFHSRKISTDRKFSGNVIFNSWKFSTLQFFSNVKFVSANHISQNFLSVENFPEWKWAFTDNMQYVCLKNILSTRSNKIVLAENINYLRFCSEGDGTSVVHLSLIILNCLRNY